MVSSSVNDTLHSSVVVVPTTTGPGFCTLQEKQSNRGKVKTRSWSDFSWCVCFGLVDVNKKNNSRLNLPAWKVIFRENSLSSAHI